jgi:hypothetical protein
MKEMLVGNPLLFAMGVRKTDTGKCGEIRSG